MNWTICLDIDEKMMEQIELIIENNINYLIKENSNKYSTKGKNSSQYWLVNRPKDFFIEDPKFISFMEEYQKIILDAIKKSGHVKPDTSIENFKNCWYIEGYGNNFYHTAHFHNNGCIDGISTVLYLNVPSKKYLNDPSGKIFLVLDSGPKNNFYEQNKMIEISPKRGNLLIFPDWIIHGTYPQNSSKNEVRKTFNVDFTLNYNILNKGDINYF